MPDGFTQRDHLISAERATGEWIPELHPPELPADCALIWHTYIELHNARTSGDASPERISWPDLLAWQTVRKVDLNPWEIDTLLAMDAAALKTISEHKP